MPVHCRLFSLQLEKMQDIHQRLAEVREENRVLYNTVQDLRGNIRVFCRIRPSGATGDQSQIVAEVSHGLADHHNCSMMAGQVLECHKQAKWSRDFLSSGLGQQSIQSGTKRKRGLA